MAVAGGTRRSLAVPPEGEADPHAWVLPRLWGRAKAAMAAVEYDEFGGGRAERVPRACSPT